MVRLGMNVKRSRWSLNLQVLLGQDQSLSHLSWQPYRPFWRLLVPLLFLFDPTFVCKYLVAVIFNLELI